MARGRTRNRLELRAEYEAAEARERDRTEEEDDDEESDDDASGSDDAAEEGDETEKIAKPKKKKKAPAATEAKPKRSRTPKPTRQRVVWVVFDNSHKPVQTYEYSRRQEADDHAARLMVEKKSTYFVQPVKEDIKD